MQDIIARIERRGEADEAEGQVFKGMSGFAYSRGN